MSASTTTGATPQLSREKTQRLMGPVLGIFATSVLLGVCFNSVSPLGVRGPQTGTQQAATSEAFAKAPPSKGYFNETIAVALESSPRQAGGQPYQNQTVGMTLLPTQPAPSVPSTQAPAAAKSKIPFVSWPEVKPLLATGRILLVDARVASAYQAEHIPGAISLPSNSPATEISQFAAKTPLDSQIVVYCGSASCHMAENLADVLVGRHGFSNVKVMPGGFAEYRVAESKSQLKAVQ